MSDLREGGYRITQVAVEPRQGGTYVVSTYWRKELASGGGVETATDTEQPNLNAAVRRVTEILLARTQKPNECNVADCHKPLYKFTIFCKGHCHPSTVAVYGD